MQREPKPRLVPDQAWIRVIDVSNNSEPKVFYFLDGPSQVRLTIFSSLSRSYWRPISSNIILAFSRYPEHIWKKLGDYLRYSISKEK
jgi:hypothetical protein